MTAAKRTLTLVTVRFRRHDPIDVDAFDDTPSLRSVSLETLHFQWHPGISCLDVGCHKMSALADDLPVWKRGYTEIVKDLLLSEALE